MLKEETKTALQEITKNSAKAAMDDVNELKGSTKNPFVLVALFILAIAAYQMSALVAIALIALAVVYLFKANDPKKVVGTMVDAGKDVGAAAAAKVKKKKDQPAPAQLAQQEVEPKAEKTETKE
nr:hypothetical protein BdHM001_35140 [Bdellovibrio sp. HM001]